MSRAVDQSPWGAASVMIDCVEVPLRTATARGMLRSAPTLRLRPDHVTVDGQQRELSWWDQSVTSTR
jgi:hypothetical protein